MGLHVLLYISVRLSFPQFVSFHSYWVGRTAEKSTLQTNMRFNILLWIYHRLGFHWPPFCSVYHLHLHVISPIDQIKFIYRKFGKYNPKCSWFTSVSEGLKPSFVLMCTLSSYSIFYMIDISTSCTLSHHFGKAFQVRNNIKKTFSKSINIGHILKKK